MIHRCILCLILSGILISCSNTQENTTLTPMLGSFNDLSDEKLFEAIEEFINLQGAPPNSTYSYERVDLNDDGTRDALVLFSLPHSHWCGWDGCMMTVFQVGNSSFNALNTIKSVRGPIHISQNQTNGWRNIILRVTGTNMPDKNVAMKFNGNQYPDTPMLAEDLNVPLSTIKTIKLFPYKLNDF